MVYTFPEMTPDELVIINEETSNLEYQDHFAGNVEPNSGPNLARICYVAALLLAVQNPLWLVKTVF